MNVVVDNFDQILEFAKQYALPTSKKRAVVREYLQVKILDMIYQEKTSLHLHFVGGTSLRLLRGLDRFSEDLDFDLAEISPREVNNIVIAIHKRLKKENITVDLYQNMTARRAYFELRFKDLLYELGISQDREEKLTIKFDFEKLWQKEKKDNVLLNRYGFLTNVVTIPLGQILVQKFAAYMHRKQTMPRDIYDIIWLTAQGTKIDHEFAKANGLKKDLVKQAQGKFLTEVKKVRGFQGKLRPFLINENYIEKIGLFSQVLNTIGTNQSTSN